MKRSSTGLEAMARGPAEEGVRPACPEDAAPRPAEASAGCPQRALAQVLKRLRVNVAEGCDAPLVALGGGRTLIVTEAWSRGGLVAPRGDPGALARSLGARRVREVDVFDLAQTEAALREELARPEPSLLVARGRCPMSDGARGRLRAIREERCNRCGSCLRLGCPAISDRLDAMVIEASTCAGCGLCEQACRAGAIERVVAPCGDPLRGATSRRAGGFPPAPHDWRAVVGGPPPVVECGRARDAALARRPRPLGAIPGGETNVVMAGMAGQPVAETARLLAEAAVAAGLDASVSERPPPLACGGPVAAHVRMGGEVRPSLVREGEAHVLVGFERLEALRAGRLLARDGFAAVSDRLVPTWRMRAGLEAAPDAEARLGAVTPRVVAVPIESLTRPLGGEAYAGLVLLGLVSALLPVPAGAYRDALRSSHQPDPGACERAFERGRDLFAELPERVAGAAGAGAKSHG